MIAPDVIEGGRRQGSFDDEAVPRGAAAAAATAATAVSGVGSAVKRPMSGPVLVPVEVGAPGAGIAEGVPTSPEGGRRRGGEGDDLDPDDMPPLFSTSSSRDLFAPGARGCDSLALLVAST